MLARAQFAELAQTEFDAAVEYHQVEANMGAAFAREVRRVIELAIEFPDFGTLVQQRRVQWQVRKFRLNPEFPYDVCAMIVPEQQLLVVLAIAHHKRRPEYWISRAAEP